MFRRCRRSVSGAPQRREIILHRAARAHQNPRLETAAEAPSKTDLGEPHPWQHGSRSYEHSLGMVSEFVRALRSAGPNLIVINTAIGAANRVALVLDRVSWPEIVGTVSGDDTIFVATTGMAAQKRLVARLQGSISSAELQ